MGIYIYIGIYVYVETHMYAYDVYIHVCTYNVTIIHQIKAGITIMIITITSIISIIEASITIIIIMIMRVITSTIYDDRPAARARSAEEAKAASWYRCL